MNSFILSAIAVFFKSFVGMLRKSGVYALFMKIYNSISSAWKNSSIISFISNKKNVYVLYFKCFLYKVLNNRLNLHIII